MYLVVEFPDTDGEVAVICKKWLKSPGVTYWPPPKKVSQAAKKAMNVEKDTWTSHRVRILHHCGKVFTELCYFWCCLRHVLGIR